MFSKTTKITFFDNTEIIKKQITIYSFFGIPFLKLISEKIINYLDN